MQAAAAMALRVGQRVEVDTRQVAGRFTATVVAVDPVSGRVAVEVEPLPGRGGRHRRGRARGASFELRTRR